MKFLRSRAAPQLDAACGVDPPHLLLGENAQDVAQGLAGRSYEGGQGAGDFGRQLESSEEVTKLDALEKAGSQARTVRERDA